MNAPAMRRCESIRYKIAVSRKAVSSPIGRADDRN
jgi:hypothetical protein